MTDFNQLRDELFRTESYEKRFDLLERELINHRVEQANEIERWRAANDNKEPPIEMLITSPLPYEALVTTLLMPKVLDKVEPKLFVFNNNRKDGKHELDTTAA